MGKLIRGNDRARFESYVDRSAGPDACHLWTGSQCTGGYGQMRIRGKLELVHIVAWQFERGSKSPHLDLDHECHNQAVRNRTCRPGICTHRLCVNLAHIVAKTRQQHRADTADWTHPKGSSHGKAKLNEQQVRQIRVLLKEGAMMQNDIAKLYKVSPYVISQIKLKKSWAWLPDSQD